jgi:hypothetical protein
MSPAARRSSASPGSAASWSSPTARTARPVECNTCWTRRPTCWCATDSAASTCSTTAATQSTCSPRRPTSRSARPSTSTSRRSSRGARLVVGSSRTACLTTRWSVPARGCARSWALSRPRSWRRPSTCCSSRRPCAGGSTPSDVCRPTAFDGRLSFNSNGGSRSTASTSCPTSATTPPWPGSTRRSCSAPCSIGWPPSRSRFPPPERRASVGHLAPDVVRPMEAHEHLVAPAHCRRTAAHAR